MRSADDEEPSVEETEEDQFTKNLPPLTAGKIRIPPALMPSEDLCLHYFDLYFTHTHPYVPVLDKNQFYHQWHNNREAISPLILEAIFAIANRLADDAAQGQQWLYLATRTSPVLALFAHQLILCFKDMPIRFLMYLD